MTEDLQGIAKKLGIATRFSDAGLVQRDYEVDPAIIKFFIHALGYKAGSAEEIAASMQEIELERWKHALEAIYVVIEDDVQLDMVVFADLRKEPLELQVLGEDGAKIPVAYEVIDADESLISGMTTYVKLKIKIHTILTVGYYNLQIKQKNKTYKTRLAVAPLKCYEPEAMSKKLWGFAVQLYSVKSERNWGVGDFSDLQALVNLCAVSGADIIGLNPLNVLMHDFPENASPYQSISRLFLNPIYIDVEKLPEFTAQDRAEVAPLLEELRGSELIRYNDVYALKIKMLQRCYERFLEKWQNQERCQQFDAFVEVQGYDLEKLAAFQALYHYFCPTVWGGWRAWPKEYQKPDSFAVKKFVEDHAKEVGFYKFMQFEADRQFMAAANQVQEKGLGVGFYRDLAVGVGKDSAELWSNPGLFIKDAGTGAPPDAFFPAGQKWGLGTFNPVGLKAEHYEPFIRILRSNMRGSGALRIDHVMSLMRLYVIPDKGELGTYIYYNFADMLNIVALESHLNKCAVVGESIGNVPEGFLDILHERNIHPLSVLWAERYGAGWGGFHAPEVYPAEAFASVGTHDMAPLKMWWYGFDIELSYVLGLIPTEEERSCAYHKRENDRWKLLEALDGAQVWPQDNMRRENYLYGQSYPEGIEEAVHRFMARSHSQVFLAQLEDFLHVEKMQNLPGTDRDKHPNWRRKLPVPLEQLMGDIAFIRNIAAIQQER